MPARYRRPSYPRRRSRSRKAWAYTFGNATTLTVGQLANLDLLAPLAVVGSGYFGATVLRVILDMTVLWGTNPITGNPFMGLGLIVGRATDLTGPTANGLNVLSNPENPWAWIKTVYPKTAPTIDAADVYAFDVRVNRRVRGVSDRFMLNISQDAAQSVTVNWSARTLVSLP